MGAFIPQCMATGIGSLPHIDREDAARLIMQSVKEIPYWPQLPKLFTKEGLVAQYLSPLINFDIVVQHGDKTYIDTEQSNLSDKLTDFYSTYLEVTAGLELDYTRFAFPKEYAAGFYAFIRYLEDHGTGEALYLKGQITGPVTIGLQLTDQNGRSVYYDEQLRDLVLKNLAMQATWQVKTLARFNLPVIIFIDEPALYAYGLSTHITLKREELIKDINTLVEAIKEAGALAGVHSCARTDWSILLESKADIISFDAYEYFNWFALYGTHIKKFLSRGGSLAWGTVPASEKVLELKTTDIVDLFRKSIDTLVQKGINIDLLMNNALLTPSCGLGTTTIPVAEKVIRLTAEVSDYLRS